MQFLGIRVHRILSVCPLCHETRTLCSHAPTKDVKNTKRHQFSLRHLAAWKSDIFDYDSTLSFVLGLTGCLISPSPKEAKYSINVLYIFMHVYNAYSIPFSIFTLLQVRHIGNNQQNYQMQLYIQLSASLGLHEQDLKS